MTGYFSLSKQQGASGAATIRGPQVDVMGTVDTVLMYAGTVLGVVFSNAVAQAQKGQVVALNLNWAWLAIASVIALMLFPQVWARVGAKTDSNLLVRVGIAVQSGAFFSVLLTAAQKAASV